MCQLVLMGLGDPTLHRIFLPLQLLLDSGNNRDGTGVFTSDGKGKHRLYKSAMCAENLPDLGLDIREIVKSKSPVIGHVRAASKGIVVTEDNAHPFVGKRFTLAHNGRLYPKDEQVAFNQVADDTGLASDSMVFLQALDKMAETMPGAEFYDILNATMMTFKGKFALLIYDMVTNKFYVARGSTADLHVLKIGSLDAAGVVSNLGIIVNTKKEQLATAFDAGMQVAQSVTGLRLTCGKIEEVKKNTLFELVNGDLVELGEIKENPITYWSPPVAPYVRKAGGEIVPVVDTSIPLWKYGDRIHEFMKSHFLSIMDIDAMFVLFLGVPFAEITLADAERFCKDVIPLASSKKKFKARLARAMDADGSIHRGLYKKISGLQYPWMLSDDKAVDALITYIESREKLAK